MPVLTVNNSTAKVIPIQAPSGLFPFSRDVPASGTLGPVAVTQALFDELEPLLQELVSRSQITYTVKGDLEHALLKGKYNLAKLERVHMEDDTPAVPLTGSLVHGDLLAKAGALFLSWRTAWLAHLAEGGASPNLDASHLVADSVNTSIGTAVDTLGHLITRIAEAKASIIGHGNQAGVHFHDDAGASGTGFTLTVDPPVTQNDCNDDINAIIGATNTHYGLASL